MTAQPSKPTKVNVKKLQSVVNDLTALQNLVNEKPAGSFNAIGAQIATSLGTKTSTNGLNDVSGIDDVDKRYQDAVLTTNQAWGDVTQGIESLITMLTNTITKHTKADTNAAKNANDTNTGGAGGQESH